MPKLESAFERHVIRELERRYPGAFVLKNNPNYLQGFPDRIFLYEDFWGAFDLKRYAGARLQPNQEYYIKLLDKMSFGMFVYPENEEVFYDEIQRALESKRLSRLP